MRTITMPDRIDQLLMEVAYDGVGVMVEVGGRRRLGRLDLPDDFGEIAFVAEGSRPAEGVVGSQARIELWHEGERLCMHARVRACSRGRLRMDRPRRVEGSGWVLPLRAAFAQALTDEVCWVPIAGASDGTFELGSRPALPLGELDGWVRMGRRAPVPVTLVVRRQGARSLAELRQARPQDRARLQGAARFGRSVMLSTG